MSSFPGSPHLVKGGLVQINASTSKVERMITLQYNPDSLSRTLQPQTVTGDGNDRSQALRLLGPPVETIKLEAEIDAADYMESGNNTVVSVGIQPQLAALEMIIYPASSAMLTNNMLSNLGTLEIFPMESPLTLFIWNKHRIIPVRFTDYSVTEEAFDVNLNPLRAKVSIGMRVLSVDDLGFDHKGGSLYMSYQQNKEKLASMFAAGSLQEMGINAIP